MKTKEQIEVEAKYDFRTYRDYLKLSQVNTKAYLMLSELIDNSISSMENHYKGQKWREKLHIKIELDFSTPTTGKAELHSISVYPKDFLKVSDNAYGMDADTLRGAMKLNNINEKSISTKNAHGRGLKQSGFFFGCDLIVNTNNGKNSLNMNLKLSSQESLDSRIIFNLEESTLEKRGTTVYIANVNAKNRLTETAWGHVKSALWERYKKHLSNNNDHEMKISYKVNFPAHSEENEITGSDEKITPVLSVFDEEKIDMVVKNSEKAFNNLVKRKSDEIDIDTAYESFEAIKELLLSSKLNSNVLFEFEHPVLFNEKVIPMRFWMLEKSNAKFRGIRVYEGKRAILHGPIVQGQLSTYLEWYNTTLRTGSTINRFAGEFDISECGLKTTTDKSTFEASQEVKDKMNKQIMTVWEIFDIFVIQARSEEKRQKGFGTSYRESSKIEAIFGSKYANEKVSFISHNTKTDLTEVEITFDDNDVWVFKIGINKKPGAKKIFTKQINEDANELEIIANTGNMFWKKIDNMAKTSFSSELVQPLCILIGMQYISTHKKMGNSDLDAIEMLNMNTGIFDENN